MAIPLLTLTALQTELSNQLGENGLQANTLAPRQQFLQDALKDAWKMYPWPFSLIDTSLAFTAGVAVLPNDFMPDGHFYLDDGINKWANVDYSERLTKNSNANTFYIRFNTTTNAYEAVMANTSGLPSTTISLSLRYQYQPLTLADTLTAGVSAPTPYPNASTLSKGALVYSTLADNPEADIAQQESRFQAAVQADYSAFNRIRMRNKRATGIAETRGHSTGMYA